MVYVLALSWRHPMDFDVVFKNFTCEDNGKNFRVDLPKAKCKEEKKGNKISLPKD